MDFIQISKTLFSSLQEKLNLHRRQKGLFGLNNASDKEVKATHLIDEVAFEVIKEELLDLPINIFMEGFPAIMAEGAKYNFYIDPVDGSRNWDRGVGDPSLCLAISEAKENLKFSNLFFAFIGGYHSQDQYFVKEGKAIFDSFLLQKEVEINTQNSAMRLSDAHAYLKPGYSATKEHFDYCWPIYPLVKDIRAIDNSGMDLCEIARGAADFSIEARKLSDFYNLLAFPILKAAGGVLTDLAGRDLTNCAIDLEGQYDFIAAGNNTLVNEILKNRGESVMD
ncbi:inositol monophosphatase family protein [Litoribacter populi]|uniref:inositol monophosphatase family protein n=1 Tax=Litoribacter populi TaxID=2598460 RepID=UPI00117FF3DF|nr:inositol monophosphatase family protein [Litoribacter populi]